MFDCPVSNAQYSWPVLGKQQASHKKRAFDASDTKLPGLALLPMARSEQMPRWCRAFLQPEPYAVGCPAHEPKMPELPAAAVLTAFPNSRPPQDQQQHAVVPEHPQLPVLRCRTTRHRAVGEAGGTPVAGSRDRDGTFTPVYPGGGSPMHMDSCGLGGESDFTPRAGSEDRDLDAHMGSGMVAGHKRSRGGQVGMSADRTEGGCVVACIGCSLSKSAVTLLHSTGTSVSGVELNCMVV